MTSEAVARRTGGTTVAVPEVGGGSGAKRPSWGLPLVELAAPVVAEACGTHLEILRTPRSSGRTATAPAPERVRRDHLDARGHAGS